MNTEPRFLRDDDPWILAEDIPDIDFQFSQIWLSSFVNDLERTVGRNYRKILAIYQGANLKFYYGEKDSFDFADHLLHLITDTPEFGKKINSEIRRLSDLFKKECEKLSVDHLKTLSNDELAALYRSLDALHTELYTWGWLPNAVDMFHGNLTNWIRRQLSEVVPETEVNDAMVLVTVSPEKSVVQQEHESLLKLASMKQAGEKGDIFEKTLQQHFQNYFYFKHLWLGKEGVYDLDYYRKAVDDILAEGRPANQRLQEEETFLQDQLAKRSDLLKRFSDKPATVEVFDVYAEFAVTKLYRRDAQLFWAYQMDNVFLELSKRLDISPLQARFLLPGEVIPALVDGPFPSLKEKVAARSQACAYYAEKDLDMVMTGEDMKPFQKKIIDKAMDQVAEIKGQVACVGLVRGKVRVINSVGDMDKMEPGDILVSIATNPDIVPAMKKAGAIVTEQGGITSHAAIVSRELRVPCIIGTKIATRVLKDGDEVEVNAEKGIVTVLKRA